MLEAEVLDRVRNAAPVFLERVVVDLLIAISVSLPSHRILW